jgi:hypothetical protein
MRIGAELDEKTDSAFASHRFLFQMPSDVGTRPIQLRLACNRGVSQAISLHGNDSR